MRRRESPKQGPYAWKWKMPILKPRVEKSYKENVDIGPKAVYNVPPVPWGEKNISRLKNTVERLCVLELRPLLVELFGTVEQFNLAVVVGHAVPRHWHQISATFRWKEYKPFFAINLGR